MKIVVLDGRTLNPGDLSWDALAALGDLKVYDRTAVEDVVPRALHAEAVLTNKTPLNRETIRHLTHLRYIGVLATGYNVVNVEAARKRGVVVTNVPDYCTEAVAQHVFALLLELARQAGHHAHAVRQGRWVRCPDFSFTLHPQLDIHGWTMGVVGYGRTGRAVARIARGFGMPVLVHTPHPPDALPEGIEAVDLDALFARSDVVSLHCPLVPATERLVNPATLARMKPGAYLINVARGGLVDEEALTAALVERRLAGVGLDVLGVEPPVEKEPSPLLRAPRCLITPHLAWAARSARERLLREVAENLRVFQAGVPRNAVG